MIKDPVRRIAIDRQLEQAGDAVEEAEREPEHAPHPNVPFTRPIRRPPGERGLGSDVWHINPPATLPGVGLITPGGAAADAALGFHAMSARVDNFTSSWIYLEAARQWVPPFWYGRVIRLQGSEKQRIRFETPPGITALAVDQNEVAVIVWYEEELPEVDGEGLNLLMSQNEDFPLFTVTVV